MIGEEIIYVPAGKYTIAGVVDEVSPLAGPNRPPSLIAALIAAVSSVDPSPIFQFVSGFSKYNGLVSRTRRSIVLHIPKDHIRRGVGVERRNALMSDVGQPIFRVGHCLAPAHP